MPDSGRVRSDIPARVTALQHLRYLVRMGTPLSLLSLALHRTNPAIARTIADNLVSETDLRAYRN